MTIRAAVLDVIASVAESDEVRARPDLDLFEARILDSLQTVELIVRLSDQFQFSLSPAEFDRVAWGTPARIVADIERRIASASR
jgi:D-alanine--poly(phosphoribitol) ligase subunit 2